LTDVPVFAMGPCQELFGGVYGSIDIFFNMANCLGPGQPSDTFAGIATTTPSPFTGAATTKRVQRGLLVGVLTFVISFGWFAFTL
jgi:hypothetical protein